MGKKVKQANLLTSPKVLGLDVSTKTIGFALFDIVVNIILSPIASPFAEDQSKMVQGWRQPNNHRIHAKGVHAG